MRGMFSMDSPLMEFLTKIADLIIINLLFLLVSIPIVTIGAGYSAMYSVTMKLVKNEEGVVTKQFFKAFKENLKQSTVIWIPMMLIAVGLGYDYIVVNNGVSPENFRLVIIIMAVIWGALFVNVFPLIAKFDNTLLNTIKNALVIGFTHVVKMVFMALFIAVPWVITFKRIELFPVFVMMGCSVPVFINSIWFNQIYDAMIERYTGVNSSSETDTELEDGNNEESDS